MPTPLNPQEPSKEKTMIYQKRYFQIEATTHLEVTSFVQYVYVFFGHPCLTYTLLGMQVPQRYNET